MHKEALTDPEIRALLDLNGLTFAEVKRALATPNDHPAIVKARELYHCDGDLEFDDNTLISDSQDGGEYVLCWKWVDLDESEEQT